MTHESHIFIGAWKGGDEQQMQIWTINRTLLSANGARLLDKHACGISIFVRFSFPYCGERMHTLPTYYKMMYVS